MRWTGNNSDNWRADSNWAGGGSPGNGDIARFDLATQNQTRIPSNQGNHVVEELRMQDPSIGDFTITINGGSRLLMDFNPSQNDKSINMTAAQHDLTINGNGELRQRNNDGNNMQWAVNGNGDLTINVGELVIQDGVNLTIQSAAGRVVDIQSDSNFSGSGITNNTAEIIKSGAGRLIFSGSQGYEGNTTVNNGVLELGTDNAIDDLSDLIFDAGATLETGGFDDTVGLLDLTGGGTATFDFVNAATSDLAFADSSAETWNNLLAIVNFTPGGDTIRFGLDENALTQDQLDAITINGQAVTIDENGFLNIAVAAIPEPSTIAMWAIVAIMLIGFRLHVRRT